jgi:hypothetical protein
MLVEVNIFLLWQRCAANNDISCYMEIIRLSWIDLTSLPPCHVPPGAHQFNGLTPAVSELS